MKKTGGGRKKSFIRWLAKEDFINTMLTIDAFMIQRIHMSERWAKRDSKINEAVKVRITIEEIRKD